MRTIGTTPVGSAAKQIWAISAVEMNPCSASMNSQSNPAALASIGTAGPAQMMHTEAERHLVAGADLLQAVLTLQRHGGSPGGNPIELLREPVVRVDSTCAV